MNTPTPNKASTITLARRAGMLAIAASLLLVPCLYAQPSAPAAIGALPADPLVPGRVANPAPKNEAPLYNIKFEGGNMLEFSYVLRKMFPEDNFVIDDSERQLRMSGFELRNVRLAEIGRTVEFLTKGKYRVEIVDNGPAGNIWRIGLANPAALVASVKMRSVAAPRLFSDEKALAEIQEAAERMRMERLMMVEVFGGTEGSHRGALLKPLASQKIFFILGDEDAVAGLESLVKAAEQRLADAAAAFAADAPKVRAVLAPHVFADKQRTEKVINSLEEMRFRLARVSEEIRRATGSDAIRLAWAEAHPHATQKVFMLIGTETAIAGMESLINAAEKLAAEEDAKVAAVEEAKRVHAMRLEAERLAAERMKAKLREEEVQRAKQKGN